MLKIADTDKDLKNWITDLREFQLDSIFNIQVLGRAYEYIAIVDITLSDSKIIEATLKEYDVSIRSVENTIIGHCSCPHSAKCKHIAALILHQMKINF